ncbi:MAG TPA: outer membrane protein assembly factor BamE, partial [Polyangium sp.]|nr:outer membrane protein assembly factor BamE [Polyangium sp.]
NRIISPHFPAMPAFPFSRACFAVLAASAAAMSGCSSVDSLSRGITDSITPYRVEVVQGNFVSREQVEALRTGMTRQQVREVLGSPLLTSVFHADRWDYVFILKRQGVEPQARKLAVYFKGEKPRLLRAAEKTSRTSNAIYARFPSIWAARHCTIGPWHF